MDRFLSGNNKFKEMRHDEIKRYENEFHEHGHHLK